MNIDVPSIAARFSPVFWEPMVGSNERITVMVAIEPEPGQSNLVPAVHLVIPPKRLKAMLGIARGNSAFGILSNTAEFMTSRLAAGLTLDELDAPFGGFTVGRPRSIKAYSEDQLLSGAVQMVSALGDVDDLLEGDLGETRILATTSAFLKSVQIAFSADIKERRHRFSKILNPGGPDAVTIDYAHKKWLVQFTSLPSTLGQTPYMIREAESKMLELMTAQQFVESETKPVLIINRQPILQISGDIQKAADDANERFKLFAKRHKIRSVEIDSKSQAVDTLESFV